MLAELTTLQAILLLTFFNEIKHFYILSQLEAAAFCYLQTQVLYMMQCFKCLLRIEWEQSTGHKCS